LTVGTLRGRTERALEEAGITPRRRLGQNYVVDEGLISCLIETACLTGNETVLEIGAGTGNLTCSLAERARRVIAVEKDTATARYLGKRLSTRANVEVIEGDILSMALPKADKVVSNLPYSISTPITFKLLTEGEFNLAVLTYQTEVAERLVALPGTPDYSRLSVMVALLAKTNRIRSFPPESFYPKPKVGSTVVAMERRGAGGLDIESLEGTLKALFSQRRRVLKKALRAYAKIRGADEALAVAVVPPDLMGKRVFEISPAEFLELDRRLRGAKGEGKSKGA
jgi:16S rRNA (adenine1518-N6/adenine1519-N6)-dimethyltransferase